jgi:succinyl-CoA synthetase beta subunit
MMPRLPPRSCPDRSGWSSPRSMPAAAARASSRNWVGRCQGRRPRAFKSVEDVVANAKEMLGNTLVTKQTGPAGKQVNRLYIEDGADIAGALPVDPGRPHRGPPGLRCLDRGRHGHRGGGRRDARQDHQRADRPGAGVTACGRGQADCDAWKLTGGCARTACRCSRSLYKAFTEKDMSLLEVNPLIVMGTATCACWTPRCRSTAMPFRHPELADLRDLKRKKTTRKSRRPSTTSPTSRWTVTSAAW